MEPAFYMIFIDGMSSPTVKHKTIEDALKEAKRLVINTTSEVHILAHHETYKREIHIIQVK
jgi:precorrin-6B methylase 2